MLLLCFDFTDNSQRPLEEENGTPLQYSCQEKPMDRGGWWATVHGAAKVLDTTQWLNNNKCS